MKLFGVSVMTIILIVVAYYAGTKGWLGGVTSTVKSAV